MSELIQYADYTTLSREGETLIAFSQNRRGGVDSPVSYTHLYSAVAKAMDRILEENEKEQ